MTDRDYYNRYIIGAIDNIIYEHQRWLNGDHFAAKANFSNANLEGLEFRFTNLALADFTGANLVGADFTGANLVGADFAGANLCRSTFSCANLCNAALYSADLTGANFTLANLTGACFDTIDRSRLGVILTEPMIGYKKCQGGDIVELEIPAGAIVFSINNYKCRTNRAVVKKIYGIDSFAALSGRRTRVVPKTRAISVMRGHFSYYVGDVINIKNFNTQYNIECAEGIHFFKDLNYALNYVV